MAEFHPLYLARRPAEDIYRGLSHEQASRLGLDLIHHAAAHGCWVFLPEHLLALRSQMGP